MTLWRCTLRTCYALQLSSPSTWPPTQSQMQASCCMLPCLLPPPPPPLHGHTGCNIAEALPQLLGSELTYSSKADSVHGLLSLHFHSKVRAIL